MQSQRLLLEETLRILPPQWGQDPLPHIDAALEASGRKIVILDDDVMGAQSVHDIAVLMDWSVDGLRAEFATDARAFFVVTNSRGMPASQAQAVNTFVARNISEAAQQSGVEFTIISRLDSTLRGHFPIEMRAIENSLPKKPDGWIIAPTFLEGGRYTVNDTQYVADGEWLIPVGETEFARDAAFAFEASDLRQWAAEKSGGEVAADSIVSVSIEDLRIGGPQRVVERLTELPADGVCVVNGASNRDMEVFVQGLLQVEASGRRFLIRAAASFIKALLGQSERALLTAAELGAVGDGGALIVVGSHVPRTTQQLNHLLANTDAKGVEADVAQLLSNDGRKAEIARVARAAEDALLSGDDAVVYSSRALVRGRSADQSLAIGHQVSQALAEIVVGIGAVPRCIVIKGGATSGIVATNALRIRRAWSPGQAAPGVPVWMLGDEALHPGMACVIFPGNVGGEDTLTKLVARVSGR